MTAQERTSLRLLASAEKLALAKSAVAEAKAALAGQQAVVELATGKRRHATAQAKREKLARSLVKAEQKLMRIEEGAGPSVIDRILAALDEQRRTTSSVAERAGLAVGVVGPALQDLAVRPLRGIATARGRKLRSINQAADARLVEKHYGQAGPMWSRRTR